MRYFKCDKVNTTEEINLKQKYTTLTEKEKRYIRKSNAMHTIATIVFLTVSILCLICFIFLIAQIPAAGTIFLEILSWAGSGILILTAIVVSLLIGSITSAPIFSKVDKNYYSSMKQKILSEACARLREYYGLQEPCLVTKCYDASNKKFVNHDVCIFVVGDELRITTNLKHGFFHGEHDLGCYAFKVEEISLSKRQGEEYMIAELKADNIEFLLGYRAKRFIERNFLVSINECGKDGSDGMS